MGGRFYFRHLYGQKFQMSLSPPFPFDLAPFGNRGDDLNWWGMRGGSGFVTSHKGCHNPTCDKISA